MALKRPKYTLLNAYAQWRLNQLTDVDLQEHIRKAFIMLFPDHRRDDLNKVIALLVDLTESTDDT